MASNDVTIYFDNAQDARDAQRVLSERGIDSEIHANSSDGSSGGNGESFMDRVRDFFGGSSSRDGEHASAAFLTLSTADDDAYAIARQYGGRIGGSAVDDSQRTVLAGSNDDTGEQRLRLHEERLNLSKEQVAEGEFRARKETVTEHQNVDVPVMHEEVYVERRPVSDASDDAAIDEDEREIRIPVTHEEIRVEKRPVTTEEIVIGKRQVQETQTVGGDVRKERVRFESDVDVDERNVSDRTDR